MMLNTILAGNPLAIGSDRSKQPWRKPRVQRWIVGRHPESTKYEAPTSYATAAVPIAQMLLITSLRWSSASASIESAPRIAASKAQHRKAGMYEDRIHEHTSIDAEHGGQHQCLECGCPCLVYTRLFEFQAHT